MNNFNECKIPKKSGGTRTIYIYKDDEMKKRHRVFLRNIKSVESNYKIYTTYNAVGFTKYSLHESVMRHKKSTCFLQMDLKNFFPSITEDLMYEHVPLLMRFPEVRECFQDGKLCQGSVLAPWISNVYMYEFDKRIGSLSNWHDIDIVYTRYADDVVLSFKSSNEEDMRGTLRYLLETITAEVENMGLELNNSKTQFRYKGKHNHVKILGFNIAFTKGGNKITIGRKTRSNPKTVYPFHFHAKKDIPAMKCLEYGKHSWKSRYNKAKQEKNKMKQENNERNTCTN